MRDLNRIQGSGSTSLYSQESVHVIVIEGVQKGTQRAALFQAFVGRNLLRNFVAINEKLYGILCIGILRGITLPLSVAWTIRDEQPLFCVHCIIFLWFLSL